MNTTIFPAIGLSDIGGALNSMCSVVLGCSAAKSAVSVAKTTTKVADFASDPFGYIHTSMEQACEDLSRNLFGQLVSVLHPDFSATWFLNAYKVSFALGIIVMGFLLMSELVAYRNGKRGTDEVIDNVFAYVPVYFLGVMIGPFVGNLLCQTIGALCDGLVNWGGGSNGMKGASGNLTSIITASTPGALMGGAILGIILFFFMIIAFIGIAVGLIMMFITLYMSGSIFPLAWAWIVRNRDRSVAYKTLNVFLGVLLSQPVVFFMLGVVMAMVKSNLFGTGRTGSPSTRFFSLLAGVVALFMVAFTPWAMTKFSPIGANANAAPSMGGFMARASRSGRLSTSSDGQLGQISRSQSTGADAGSVMSAMNGAGTGAAGGPDGAAAGALGGATGSSGAGAGVGAGGVAAGAAGGAALAGKVALDKAKDIGEAGNASTDAAMGSGDDLTSGGAGVGSESDAEGTSGGALAGSVESQHQDPQDVKAQDAERPGTGAASGSGGAGSSTGEGRLGAEAAKNTPATDGKDSATAGGDIAGKGKSAAAGLAGAGVGGALAATAASGGSTGRGSSGSSQHPGSAAGASGTGTSSTSTAAGDSARGGGSGGASRLGATASSNATPSPAPSGGSSGRSVTGGGAQGAESSSATPENPSGGSSGPSPRAVIGGAVRRSAALGEVVNQHTSEHMNTRKK